MLKAKLQQKETHCACFLSFCVQGQVSERYFTYPEAKRAIFFTSVQQEEIHLNLSKSNT